MTFDEAQKILININESTKEDELLLRLKRDVFLYAVRYARIRTDWLLADVKTRQEADPKRRMAHEALIDACNILSRNQLKRGGDNAWRKHLGTDRKVIGDFACYVHCILGIEAR